MTNYFAGQLVRLRAVQCADWEIHLGWNLDTESARLGYEIPFPTSPEAVKAWVDAQAQRPPEHDSYRFQIETLSGELVGTLNTHTCDVRNGTFKYGVMIRTDRHRQGYASEAIRLILRYYFEERRYQKVTVEIYSFNAPSIRLHEKLGFVLEGRLRPIQFSGGKFHDVLVYGLTSDEFQKHYSSATQDTM